jgi:redox-sensitive bicupin YhaK (pirin superfamily)
MIDEINSDNATDYIGGFPEHPHRGFETITYMKAGRMRHRDHMGNEGVIRPGDVQWMTAGAGVLHSEMPEQDGGLLHGFQLWLNLPASEKMKPAAYRDIRSDEIVRRTLEHDGSISVIAGEIGIESALLAGPIQGLSTEPVILDIQLAAHSHADIKLASEHPVLVYVYQGSTDQLNTRELGVFGSGANLHLVASDRGVQLLVLSGRPIREPVVQYGPFVMNTQEEIEQALRDHRNNQLVATPRSG